MLMEVLEGLNGGLRLCVSEGVRGGIICDVSGLTSLKSCNVLSRPVSKQRVLGG